jgi:TrmH family RNA methyltransferase
MIESKDNSKIKLVKMLSSKKGREKEKLYIAEGEILVYEYLKSSHKIEFILCAESYTSDNVDFGNVKIFKVRNEIFDSISNTQNSQGIIAVVHKQDAKLNDLTENNTILFLDSLQDPGNMGTIIRTADAFGIGGIICNKGCVDVYNPKTVRAAMGSMTRVKFYFTENDKETVLFLKEKNYKIFSAVVDGNIFLEDIKEALKSVIVIGNESRGIKEEIKYISDVAFSIKMTGGSESLNAGVAASICLYHFGNKTI